MKTDRTVLVGEIYHDLQILETGRGHSKVLVRCKCGTETRIAAKNIHAGNSKRCKKCGCVAGGSVRRKDCIGVKFGYLTVLERSSKKLTLRCDCGSVVVRSYGAVQQGDATSCGCMSHVQEKKETDARDSLLVGTKRGSVSILALGDRNRDKRKLLAVCDCGKKWECSVVDYAKDRVRTCGHERLANMVKAVRARARRYVVFGAEMTISQISTMTGYSKALVAARIKQGLTDSALLAKPRTDGPHLAAKRRAIKNRLGAIESKYRPK